MQKTLQMTPEKSTSPYPRPRHMKLRLEEVVVPSFKLEVGHEKTWTAPLDALIQPGQLKGLRRARVVVKEPADWFAIIPDVDWGLIFLEQTSLSGGALSDIERFEQEREAFLRIKDDLLEREMHVEEFIAIYEGQVVDHDTDIVELASRVYRQYGYVPIYMDKVEREEEVVELPSPEG